MDGQELDDKIKPIQKQLEWLGNLTLLGLIVLFIGFAALFGTIATLVISHFDSSHASYEDLKDQVQSQNDKIDNLTTVLTQIEKNTTPAK